VITAIRAAGIWVSKSMTDCKSSSCDRLLIDRVPYAVKVILMKEAEGGLVVKNRGTRAETRFEVFNGEGSMK
jgi:hypothetical protein